MTETQQVSVDVTTDVTSAVEKAADSVVGITNIQSVTDFWNHQKRHKKLEQVQVLFIKKKAEKHLLLRIIT